MAKFSDRIGITQPPKDFQINGMTDDLRVSLWNWVVKVLQWDGGRKSVPFIYSELLMQPLDALSQEEIKNWGWLRSRFMSLQWHEAYNFVEFLAQNISVVSSSSEGQSEFINKLNSVLERELSGYRLINMELVPITDKHEIDTIRQALSDPALLGFEGASRHIEKALSLLGKKPDPDYPNSIKESISAVESISKLLTGEKSGGLDKALGKLSTEVNIHPALRQSFLKLYGYTSDESGIRHAILDSKDVGFAEAKFMLVVCSAFINFILDKSGNKSAV